MSERFKKGSEVCHLVTAQRAETPRELHQSDARELSSLVFSHVDVVDEAVQGTGRVLEIGAGNGLNFTHYPSSVDVMKWSRLSQTTTCGAWLSTGRVLCPYRSVSSQG
ncbi:MAG: hypothetical protein ACREA0_31205 [bacterium]